MIPRQRQFRRHFSLLRLRTLETRRTCTRFRSRSAPARRPRRLPRVLRRACSLRSRFRWVAAVLHDATIQEDVRQCLLRMIEQNATLALESSASSADEAAGSRRERSWRRGSGRHPQMRARGTVRHRNTTCSRASRPRPEAPFHYMGVLKLMHRAHFQSSQRSRVVASRVGSAEQSNTSIIYGNQLILKLFRRLQPGENPDVEIGRFLTEVAHFPHIPPFLGEIAVTQPDGKKTTAAMLQGLVANQGDGWQWFLGQLAEFFPAVAALACAACMCQRPILAKSASCLARSGSTRPRLLRPRRCLADAPARCIWRWPARQTIRRSQPSRLRRRTWRRMHIGSKRRLSLRWRRSS